MLERNMATLLLKLLPGEWRGRLGRHLGAPDLLWSLGQLARFGFSAENIMDVGAFHGRWTRTCLLVFPRARFTCIEPQNEPQDILKELARRNANVRVIQTLLGSRVREFVPFEEMGPGSSILGSGMRQTGRPMNTIDHLIEGGFCGPPQLLKLDVQGYELEVLEGYTRYFGACEVIQCEISLLPLIPGAPLLAEVIHYLAGRGFVMFDVDELIHAPSDGATWQMDVLFCRAHSPLRRERVWREKS